VQISVTEAKGQLTALVRRAEAGEEVVLTRHGRMAVRLVPVRSQNTLEGRGKLIEALQQSAAVKATPGESAASSQDFLYDDDGLPR
jgi:prevent-host-death family protein